MPKQRKIDTTTLLLFLAFLEQPRVNFQLRKKLIAEVKRVLAG